MTVINDEDYTRENREIKDSAPADEPNQSTRPEPPLSWNPPQEQMGPSEHQQLPEQNSTQPYNANRQAEPPHVKGIRLAPEESVLYESARKLASAAQICALISLVIGGVALSTVALVLACMSLGRFSRLSDLRGDDPYTSQSMRYLARRALLLSVIALAVNVVALILIYPMIVEMFQTGDPSSLIGWGQGTGSPSSGNSTWG